MRDVNAAAIVQVANMRVEGIAESLSAECFKVAMKSEASSRGDRSARVNKRGLVDELTI